MSPPLPPLPPNVPTNPSFLNPIVPPQQTAEDSTSNHSHAPLIPATSKYPDVRITSHDTDSFVANVRSDPTGPEEVVRRLTEVLRGWINNSTNNGPKCKQQRERKWKSFKVWKELWVSFKKIDERRMERQMEKASKKLLSEPPKKRKPPQISSLLHYHNTVMHTLLDYSSFPVFPTRISKKQLQHFYKTVRLRTFGANTPLTCQGQHSDSYFVLFRGRVAVFRAGDRRQTELFNVVQPSVLVGPHSKDLTGGYLGKPMYDIDAPHESAHTPGIGFGGVMLTKEKSETWMASAVTLEESDVLVVEPKVFKSIFLKDHRSKYVLARRTASLSTMPVFKLLLPSHLQKLSQDFRNNSYVAKSRIVDVADPMTKIIVVAEGEVDVTAKVEDPRAPGRILEVTVARLGKGGIIGDIELVYSKSIFTLSVTARTAAVETFEMSRENFNSNIFDNSHADAAKEKLLKSVGEKVVFNKKRVEEEMLKFAHFTRREQAQRAKATGFKGGIAEKIDYVKSEWERNYRNFLSMEVARSPARMEPEFDYAHDTTLYLQRDVTSRSGVRVMSRAVRKVKKRQTGDLIPEGILKDESKDYEKPFIDRESRGSLRGGNRGGKVDFRAMMEEGS